MQASDRIYFIDPVQAPTLKLPENPRIVTFDTYRHSEYEEEFELGRIQSVSGVSFDGRGRAWYIGESDNWVDGAIINGIHYSQRQAVIGWVGDLTVQGTRQVGTEDHTLISSVLRSDRKRFGLGNDVTTIRVQNSAKAAPWAQALFPEPTDTDAVVEAKLAQAKVKWDHRRKHAHILREGMQRGWLDYLKEDGIHSDHGLPEPRWDALVDGTANIYTNTSRIAERSELLADRGYLGDMLNSMPPAERHNERVLVQETVAIPFRTTLHVTRSWDSRGAATNDTSYLEESMHDRLNDWTTRIQFSSVRPILSTLV